MPVSNSHNIAISVRSLASAWLVLGLLVLAVPIDLFAADEPRLYRDPIDMHVPPISSDKSVKYDYDIVYVRAPRKGDKTNTKWAEIVSPTNIEPGSDLMLLHPDGSE